MKARQLLILLLLAVGCTPRASEPTVVGLRPHVPTDSLNLRYSPRGEKLALDADARTNLTLADQAFALQLERSPGSDYYDRLHVDTDGDGHADLVAETQPSETRGKIWSSFEATLHRRVEDPATDAWTTVPYPVALWYVYDPLEESAEEVIRFSRRGWAMGSAVLDGVPALVMVTESVMDGILDEQDSWAMAPGDSASVLLSFGATRPANRHAWLGERAYRLASIHPSGLQVSLISGDPGITRAEEAAQEDVLAVDRQAPRSGRSVNFLPFEEAAALAASENKPLFVDFKTVWCGPCYTMDEWVFTADAVVDAASSVVATKVDGDERRDLAKRFNVTAYPTVLLLDSAGSELKRYVGYLGVDSTALFLSPVLP